MDVQDRQNEGREGAKPHDSEGPPAAAHGTRYGTTTPKLENYTSGIPRCFQYRITTCGERGRWLPPAQPQPRSVSLASSMPKWCATSWITVFRTLATISGSLRETAQMLRMKIVMRSGMTAEYPIPRWVSGTPS